MRNEHSNMVRLKHDSNTKKTLRCYFMILW